MSKRISIFLGVVVLVLIGWGGAQSLNNGWYYNAVCGEQYYVRKFLVFDFSEVKVDEWGTRQRWESIHGMNCPVDMRRVTDVDPVFNENKLSWLIARNGSFGQVKKLVLAEPSLANKADKFGQTPLHWAYSIQTRRVDKNGIIEFLKKHGADERALDAWGKSPADWMLDFE